MFANYINGTKHILYVVNFDYITLGTLPTYKTLAHRHTEYYISIYINVTTQCAVWKKKRVVESIRKHIMYTQDTVRQIILFHLKDLRIFIEQDCFTLNEDK